MQGSFLPDDLFVYAADRVSKKIHTLSREQGLWDDRRSRKEIALKIAHIHSELSEAFECLRIADGKQPDKDIEGFTGLEVQLADALGILLDLQDAYNLRITQALLHKMDFNNTKRGYLHGKGF